VHWINAEDYCQGLIDELEKIVEIVFVNLLELIRSIDARLLFNSPSTQLESFIFVFLERGLVGVGEQERVGEVARAYNHKFL